jgi:hypothetical protein
LLITNLIPEQIFEPQPPLHRQLLPPPVFNDLQSRLDYLRAFDQMYNPNRLLLNREPQPNPNPRQEPDLGYGSTELFHEANRQSPTYQ